MLGLILLIDLILIVLAALIIFVFNVIRGFVSICCPQKLADKC